MTNNRETAIVILNWNRSDLTATFLRSFIDVENIQNVLIIIVDNGSEPGERAKLFESIRSMGNFLVLDEDSMAVDRELDRNSDILLLLNKNYGYAKGNNFGLKLALNVGCRYAIVANNDVVLEMPVIEHLLQCMKLSQNVAVIGPRILGTHDKQQGPYEKLTLYHYFFYPVFFPLSWPIEKIRKMIKRDKNLENKDCGKIRYPYRVIGSFMLVDLEVLKQVDWFDENTFLYAEELILAEKLQGHGYKMAYTDSVYVRHIHGSSASNIGRMKIVAIALESELYYLKNYRNYGGLKLFLAKIGFLYKNLVLVSIKDKFLRFTEHLRYGRKNTIA